MKMDLYLQRKQNPYDLVKFEGIEIADELLGTWSNQRATIELPFELVPENIEEFKGIARLYNSKRQARRHFKYSMGWRLAYYFPQKWYRNQDFKTPYLPMLWYYHGGLDENDVAVQDMGIYDYIKLNTTTNFRFERMLDWTNKYVAVWRFYIPADFPETYIRRDINGWYFATFEIYPDGTSTISALGTSATTTIFQRGYSYLVAWVYYYSIIQHSEIFIQRSDGAIDSVSLPNYPYPNYLEGITLQVSFPYEDMWFVNLQDDSHYSQVLTDLNIYTAEYTNLELYNPDIHDEQVFFVEKITYEEEEGNKPVGRWTLELSDITSLETVVAPYTIQWKETTETEDVSGDIVERYFIETIPPSYSNFVRSMIYTLAMFEVPLDLDFDVVVVGNDGDYTYWIQPQNLYYRTGSTGTNFMFLLAATEDVQFYIQGYRYSTGCRWRVLTLNKNGFKSFSGWFLLSGGRERFLPQFRRPFVLIDSVIVNVYFVLDVLAWNVWTSERQGKSYIYKASYHLHTQNLSITYADFDTAYGSPTEGFGGYSQAYGKILGTNFRILWVVISEYQPPSNPPWNMFALMLDENLNVVSQTSLTDTPISDNIVGYFWNEDDYYTREFLNLVLDWWQIIGDKYKCVLCDGRRAYIFQVDFSSSHTHTYDGTINNISDVRMIAEDIAVAVWKGNLLVWRRDFANYGGLPQYAYVIPLEGLKQLTYIDYAKNTAPAKYWRTIIVIGGKIFGSHPFHDWGYSFYTPQIHTLDNFLAEVGEPINTEIIEWEFAFAKVKLATNFYPQGVHWIDNIWGGNSRIKLGIPARININLWGRTYEGLGYVYISDFELIPASTKFEAGNLKGAVKWDYFGEMQQGLYRFAHIFRWQRGNLFGGYVRGLRIYDLKRETVYVKYVVMGGYVMDTISDYITDVDGYVLDNISLAPEIQTRLNENNQYLEIIQGKTPDPVFVGDIVLYNGKYYKVISLTRDNNYITSFEAVKIPI